MSEAKVGEVAKKSEHEAVDVFTHSKTEFPGAWTEDEIQTLLDLWEEVLSRPRSRRYSVSKRVFKRLLNKTEFKQVTKEEIGRQMSTLRTEYTTYLGLQIIGIDTVRPKYVDQLERIFSKLPLRNPKEGRQRRNTEPTKQSEISEDSDHSRSQSLTYGDKEPKMESDVKKPDDVSSTMRRGRYPRVNVQRLIRTMLNQHNAMMEQVEKLFVSLEESNAKSATLLEELLLYMKKLHSSNTGQIETEAELTV